MTGRRSGLCGPLACDVRGGRVDQGQLVVMSEMKGGRGYRAARSGLR